MQTCIAKHHTCTCIHSNGSTNAKKSGGFGISISGGLDRPLSNGNTGIYITKIIPDTLAAQDGRLR